MAVSTSVLDMLAKGPKPLGPVVAEGLRYRQPRAEGASKNLEQQDHLVEKSRPSGLAGRKNSCEWVGMSNMPTPSLEFFRLKAHSVEKTRG